MAFPDPDPVSPSAPAAGLPAREVRPPLAPSDVSQHGAAPDAASDAASGPFGAAPGRVFQRVFRRRSYRRPPVVEAVVDLTAAHEAPVDLADLARVTDGDELRYPIRNTLIVSDLALNQAAGVVEPLRQQIVGFQYTTAHPVKAAVQVRQDGFAFSRHAPTPDAYPAAGWDEWHREAARLWAKYVAVTRPAFVTQLRVRYVNRLAIPSVQFLPQDYFTLYPEVPDDLSPDMAGYLFRVNLPRPDVPGAMLTVTQGVLDQAPAAPGTTFMLLDIDLVCRTHLAPDADEVWDLLNLLHAHVIDAFEASITDTARGLFA